MTAAAALAAVLLLASAESPYSDCVKAALPPGDLFKECAMAKARQLEPSGESPNDIAIAAAGACFKFKKLFLGAAAQCLPADMVNSLDAKIENKARDLAIEAVVEIRAQRHSPK